MSRLLKNSTYRNINVFIELAGMFIIITFNVIKEVFIMCTETKLDHSVEILENITYINFMERNSI